MNRVAPIGVEERLAEIESILGTHINPEENVVCGDPIIIQQGLDHFFSQSFHHEQDAAYCRLVVECSKISGR